MKNRIHFWIKNARDIALPQSLLPTFLTVALVFGEPNFSWFAAVLSLFGVAFAHLGMNLADDYFDFRQDTTRIRSQVVAEGFKTHLEKCHYMLSGQATTKDLLRAIAVFLGIAGIFGGVILLIAEPAVRWQIAALAVVGLILGLSYSAWPLKLGYRGFGEFTIGAMFGPLLMAGVSLATVGHVSTATWLLSVAVGVLVINIVFVHSVLDVRVDTLSCRKSFAVLLRNKTAMLVALGCFTFVPFAMVVVGVILGIFPWFYLLTLVLLPMGVQLIYSTFCYLFDREITIEPHWYLGPMGDWETYRKADMDWFLFRWLVARNIVTFFCLIIILGEIIVRFIV